MRESEGQKKSVNSFHIPRERFITDLADESLANGNESRHSNGSRHGNESNHGNEDGSNCSDYWVSREGKGQDVRDRVPGTRESRTRM